MNLTDSESSLSTPKSSDIIQTPSSSKFLTPCRRMGLCRKKRPFETPYKSPNSTPTFSGDTGTPKRTQIDGQIHPKRIATEENLTPNENKMDLIQTVSKNCANKNAITLDMINKMKNNLETKRNKLDMLKNGELIDVLELRDMILVWRQGCKEALEDLHATWKSQRKCEEQTTMENVLLALGIPCDLVQYDTNNQEFIE